MSPAATLAAQLSALAARAAEHSSPAALSAVLVEGFGAIAATLQEAERVVGDAMSLALSELPLTAADRDALRTAGVPLPPEPAGDQVDVHLVDTSAPQDVTITATGTDAGQVLDFPVSPDIERAQRMHAAFAAKADGYQVPAWEALPQDLRDAWVAAAGAI